MPARESGKGISPVNVIIRDTEGQETDIEIIDRIGSLVEKRRTKRAVIGLTWLIYKGANPIVGIGSIVRLDDSVEASKLVLTEEVAEFFEEPYKRTVNVIFG